MRTSGPISTISYNTEEFLKSRLNKMQKDRLIEFWAYIRHDAEPDLEDECAGKEHRHLYIIPAKCIQTEDIKDTLVEPDPNNTKPLGVISFRKSEWDDWYLYAIHDPDYLRAKKRIKVYHYSDSDIITSDRDYMNLLISEVTRIPMNVYENMKFYIASGLSFADYLLIENPNVNHTYAYERAYRHMKQKYYDEIKDIH